MKKIVKTPDPVYRPIVLFDVDGVLADFTSAILELVKRHTTVHHHIEECTDWDLFEIFTKKHPEVSDLKDKLHAATLAEGFCRSLAPYAASLEPVQRIGLKTQLFIATSPTHSRTWQYERTEWLERHYGITRHRVIQCSAKHLLHGELFLDDKPEHVFSWKARHPDGIAVLWDMPYNRDRETEAALAARGGIRATGWHVVEALVDALLRERS